MSHRAGSAAREDASPPLLEIIRRKEADVKRRLAVEGAAAQATVVEAEQRARESIAAAEAEGRQAASLHRQQVQAEVEREAHTLLAQAQAEAELLRRVGAEWMEAAIRQAMAIMIEVRR